MKVKILSAALLVASVLLSCKKDEAGANGDCKTCVVAYSGTDIKATIDPIHAGTFKTEFDYAAPGAPFPNGTKAEFTLTTDGKFTVKIDGKDCVTLSNPTLFAAGHKGAYTFRDNCVTQLQFEISYRADNEKFNEVNIAPVDKTTFLGQFRIK